MTVDVPNRVAAETGLATPTVQADGRRRYRRKANGLCADLCGRARRKDGAYCDDCTAARAKTRRANKRKAAFKAQRASP